MLDLGHVASSRDLHGSLTFIQFHRTLGRQPGKMANDKKKGGLLAGNLRAAIAGAAALLFEGTAHAGGIVQPFIARARERYGTEANNTSSSTPEQLLMQPAGEDPGGLFRGHRSHSSHRSHQSHSSHYSGHSSHSSHASHYSGSAPPPTPPPAPSREPAPAPSPAPFVPVPGQEYRITMKNGDVHIGTLTDRGADWEITISKPSPKRVFVAKADVVGIRAVPK